jgi:hypothetical protein
LHLSQIFFTDALTFIAFSSFQPLLAASGPPPGRSRGKLQACPANQGH